jgi:hypothetical protein
MLSSLDRDILDHIVDYVTGETNLREFKRWFVPVRWKIASQRTPVSVPVGTIDLRLMEFSDGHWTEDQLKRQITLLIGHQAWNLLPSQEAASAVARHLSASRTRNYDHRVGRGLLTGVA